MSESLNLLLNQFTHSETKQLIVSMSDNFVHFFFFFLLIHSEMKLLCEQRNVILWLHLELFLFSEQKIDCHVNMSVVAQH